MATLSPTACTQLDFHPSSPISSLPPELLLTIFRFLVTHSSPAILLQICHRWADLASSHPPLWFRIDFSTPPSSLLQRCPDRPIEVDLSSSPAGPTLNQLEAAKEVLSTHKHRIRKLVLDLPEIHLRRITSELSPPFPVLIDVSISAARHKYFTLGPIDFSVFLWSVKAPASPVRYLRLLGLLVRTPWVPGLFQNLVEFFLHDQRVAFDPHIGIFLEILESSPRLAVLSVANAGPRLRSYTTTLPPATRTVRLRNLQQLYLEQRHPYDIGWILIHLDIPISANVKISFDFVSGGGRAPLELLFDLAFPNHPGFSHLSDLRYYTYAVDLRPACIITAPNFSLRVIWNNPSHGHFDHFMMPFLRRVTAVGVVEDFRVVDNQSGKYGIGTSQWEKIFDTLGSLQKLRVDQSQDHIGSSTWAFLQSQPPSALRDLWFSSIIFCGGEASEEEGKVTAGRLVDYCAERNQRGHRLERLVIEAPLDPPPDLVSSLAPYVDNVEIRDDISNIEDAWPIEFGSRRMFDYLRNRGYNEP